jgi:hypothetical protein
MMDTTMRKQTHITYRRNESSYKQLEKKDEPNILFIRIDEMQIII